MAGLVGVGSITRSGLTDGEICPSFLSVVVFICCVNLRCFLILFLLCPCRCLFRLCLRSLRAFAKALALPTPWDMACLIALSSPWGVVCTVVYTCDFPVGLGVGAVSLHDLITGFWTTVVIGSPVFLCSFLTLFRLCPFRLCLRFLRFADDGVVGMVEGESTIVGEITFFAVSVRRLGVSLTLGFTINLNTDVLVVFIGAVAVPEFVVVFVVNGGWAVVECVACEVVPFEVCVAVVVAVSTFGVWDGSVVGSGVT